MPLPGKQGQGPTAHAVNRSSVSLSDSEWHERSKDSGMLLGYQTCHLQLRDTGKDVMFLSCPICELGSVTSANFNGPLNIR